MTDDSVTKINQLNYYNEPAAGTNAAQELEHLREKLKRLREGLVYLRLIAIAPMSMPLSIADSIELMLKELDNE